MAGGNNKNFKKEDIEECELMYYLTQSYLKKETGFSPTMNYRRYLKLVIRPESTKLMENFIDSYFYSQ